MSITLLSCEREITRIDLLQNNSSVFRIELKKGDEVNLYTEMDIEYRNKPLFVYDCDFVEGSTFLFKGGTDPLETTNRSDESISTDKNGITHWKFYGKLEGNLVAQYDGVYGIKTTFVKNDNPDLKIHKAEIIFTN